MELLQRHLPRVYEALQSALNYLGNVTAQIFGAPPPNRQHERNAHVALGTAPSQPTHPLETPTPGQRGDTKRTEETEHFTPHEDNTVLDPTSEAEKRDPSPEQTDMSIAVVTEELNVEMELQNRAKMDLEYEAHDEGTIRDSHLPSDYGDPIVIKYDHFQAEKTSTNITFSEYDQYKEEEVGFLLNDKWQQHKATNNEELSKDPTPPQKNSSKLELNSENLESLDLKVNELENISFNVYVGSSVDFNGLLTAHREEELLEDDYKQDEGLADMDILSTVQPKDGLSTHVTQAVTESPDTQMNKEDPSPDFITKETKLTKGTFQKDTERDIKEELITSLWTSQNPPESHLVQKELIEVRELLHEEKTHLFTLEDLGETGESYEEASRLTIVSSEDISLEVPEVLSLVDNLGEDCTLETKGQCADEKGSGHSTAASESGLEKQETDRSRIDVNDHHDNKCQELNVGAFHMHPRIYGEIKLEPIDALLEQNSDNIPGSSWDAHSVKKEDKSLRESEHTIWYDEYEAETEMEVGNDNNLQIPEDTFQVTTRSLQETEELNTETLQKPKEQLQDEEQQITFSANLIKHVLRDICSTGQHQTPLQSVESNVGENNQITHVIYNAKIDTSLEEANESPVEREGISEVGSLQRMELTKEEILVREAEKSLAQDEINIVQEVECLNLRDQFQKTEPCNAQTNDDSEEESMNLLQQESSLDQPRNLAQYEEPNNSLRDIYVKEKSLPQLKDEDLQTYPLNEEIFTAMEDLISGNGENGQELYTTQNEEGSAEINQHRSLNDAEIFPNENQESSHIMTRQTSKTYENVLKEIDGVSQNESQAKEVHDSSLVKMFQSQTFEEDIHFQTMVDLYRDRTREEHCEQIDHSNEEVEQNQETYNNSTQDKLKLISSTFSGENAEYAEEKITTKLFDTTESCEPHKELNWIPQPQLLNTYFDLDFMNSGSELALSEGQLQVEHIQEETILEFSTGEPSKEIETLPKSVDPIKDEETCKTIAEFGVLSNELLLSSSRSHFSDEETERGGDPVGVMHPLHQDINIIKAADDLSESREDMDVLSDVQPEITPTHLVDDAKEPSTSIVETETKCVRDCLGSVELVQGRMIKTEEILKDKRKSENKLDMLYNSINEEQPTKEVQSFSTSEQSQLVEEENILEEKILLTIQPAEVNEREILTKSTQEEETLNTIDQLDAMESTEISKDNLIYPSKELCLSQTSYQIKDEIEDINNQHPEEEKNIIIPAENLTDLCESQKEPNMLSHVITNVIQNDLTGDCKKTLVEQAPLEEMQFITTGSSQQFVSEENISGETDNSLSENQPTVTERDSEIQGEENLQTSDYLEEIKSMVIPGEILKDLSEEPLLSSTLVIDETERLHQTEQISHIERNVIESDDNTSEKDALPNIPQNYQQTEIQFMNTISQSQQFVTEENISGETDQSLLEDQPTATERHSEIQGEENLQTCDYMEEIKSMVIPGEILKDLSEELLLSSTLVIVKEKERFHDQTSQIQRNIIESDDNTSEKDALPNIPQNYLAEDSKKTHVEQAPLEEIQFMTTIGQSQQFVSEENIPGETDQSLSEDQPTATERHSEIQGEENLQTSDHVEEIKSMVIPGEILKDLSEELLLSSTLVIDEKERLYDQTEKTSHIERNVIESDDNTLEKDVLLNIPQNYLAQDSKKTHVEQAPLEEIQFLTTISQSKQFVSEENISGEIHQSLSEDRPTATERDSEIQGEETLQTSDYIEEIKSMVVPGEMLKDLSEELPLSPALVIVNEKERFHDQPEQTSQIERNIIESDDNTSEKYALPNIPQNYLAEDCKQTHVELAALEKIQFMNTVGQSLQFVSEENISGEIDQSFSEDKPTATERDSEIQGEENLQTSDYLEEIKSMVIPGEILKDLSEEPLLSSTLVIDETERLHGQTEQTLHIERNIIESDDNTLEKDVLLNIPQNYLAEDSKKTHVEQAHLEEIQFLTKIGQSKQFVSEENISGDIHQSFSEDQPTSTKRDSEIQGEENLQTSDNLEEIKSMVIPGEILKDLSEELLLSPACVIVNEKERIHDQTQQTSQEERHVIESDENTSEKEPSVVSEVHSNITHYTVEEKGIAVEFTMNELGERIMEASTTEQKCSFTGSIEDQDAPVEQREVGVSDLLPKSQFEDSDILEKMSGSVLVDIVITTDHRSSEDKNSSEMKCSLKEDATGDDDDVRAPTNQKGEYLKTAVLPVTEKSLIAKSDEIGGELKTKETLSDQDEGLLFPHSTLDLSVQKSRVILRRKTLIRKRPRQTPDPETIEQPPPVARPLSMGVPIFPVKLPSIALLHPKPTPPPAEVHKEEKTPTEGLAVKPKKGLPRLAGFGVPHPQMMQELQNRLQKKKPKE
ncbi:uncharacterized protein LOC108703920 isoform X2 [Xenopus laevis]|uniref:Uncharacterized protein LOC108703920 isoform X2 n=1 Tax=Xenopus laevis TaxID=8355 RepID=A0A8J1LUR6_XENLA|nr:uncharacterized protein LOC108703920 isoform X2 [Xenopus laevis]